MKTAKEFIENKLGHNINLTHPVTDLDYEDIVDLIHNYHHLNKFEFPSEEEIEIAAEKYEQSGDDLDRTYKDATSFNDGANWLKSKLT
jgi:hypothetical protein